MKELVKDILTALIIAAILFTGYVFSSTVLVSHKAKSPLYAQSVVRLVDDGHTFCSGVVINKTTIVTAGHCAVDCAPEIGFCQLRATPIEIRTSANKLIGMGLVKNISSQLDRAVIKGEFGSIKPAVYVTDVTQSLATRAEGQKFYTCGYPLGGDLYCGKAIYLKNWGFFVAIKGVLIPGMSGGPMMLEDGGVVGINSQVYEDFSLVTPIYNIEGDL